VESINSLKENKMKRIYLLLSLAGMVTVPNLFASMNVTLWQDTANYSAGNGGEFRAVGDAGLDSAVDWGAYSANTSGGSGSSQYFQTFCTETSEYFSPGNTYSVSSIGNNALYNGGVNPVPITLGVAYLYSQFAAGTFAGYTYAYGAGRVASAQNLQQAIWYLLGEYQDGAQLTGAALTALQNSGIAQADWTVAADGAYGVRDMVLGTPGAAQDQLVMSTVPEASTMIAGAMLLLPFGASTIRFLRKNRAA
jgi:hypothetical protein